MQVAYGDSSKLMLDVRKWIGTEYSRVIKKKKIKNKKKNKVGTDLKALDIIFQHKQDTLRTQYCTFQIFQV